MDGEKTTHDLLLEEIETYFIENENFTNNGVKAAGDSARKALLNISKLCKTRRQEIQDAKSR